MKPVTHAKRNPVRIHVVHQHHHHYHAPVSHTHAHQHAHTHHDSVSHVHHAAIPTMAARSVPAVPAAPEDVAPPAPPAAPEPAGPENWTGYIKRQLRKLVPIVEMLCAVIMFVVSRINFGFGFRVPWLPGIGFGA